MAEGLNFESITNCSTSTSETSNQKCTETATVSLTETVVTDHRNGFLGNGLRDYAYAILIEDNRELRNKFFSTW